MDQIGEGVDAQCLLSEVREMDAKKIHLLSLDTHSSLEANIMLLLTVF
jgi:hypothetical protein